jgi:1-acyl-sn-glycerol-3-phosphate acyltransferase
MKSITGVFGLFYKIYIAVVFSLTLLVFYIPINILKQNKKTKNYTFIFFVIWSWLFRILCFIHVQFKMRSTLPNGPYIIVSNHASYLDIFLMYSLLPKHCFLFLGKAEILNYPLMKSFFINLNIPVFRNEKRKAAKSFVDARTAIKENWSLVIFPEGGIPDDNNPAMIPFKDGAFKLAKAMQIPIIPITFTNNHLLFSDPTQLLGPARPGISKVHLHKYISKEQIERLSEKEISDLCFRIIQEPLLNGIE